MTAEHNHPPRCCCWTAIYPDEHDTCPACPDHGQLAQAVECPHCHQPAGRPHTDYCPTRRICEHGRPFTAACPPCDTELGTTPPTIPFARRCTDCGVDLAATGEGCTNPGHRA